MNSILESRGIILNNIENIFTQYHNRESDNNEKVKELNEEIAELNIVNKKLIEEVSEKDKQLVINDRKMVDYEVMINKIQEEASKELTEKERFSMLKAKDKAINERDIEIRRLQKKIDLYEEKIETSSNEDNIEVVVEEKKTLVEKMKEVVDHGVEDEEVETPVVDKEDEEVEEVEEVETEVIDKEEEDEGDEEVETQVVDEEVETPVVDKEDEEEVETEVIEQNKSDGEETEDLSSEEGEEVEIITHYKKEYYIVVGEKPQYIYAIEDGELGDKVGEIDNGKKVLYKSSKK
jgi:hypothetical protein